MNINTAIVMIGAALLLASCDQEALEESPLQNELAGGEGVERCAWRGHTPEPWSVLEPEWRPSGTQPYTACVVDEDYGDDGVVDQRIERVFDGALRVRSDHFNMPEGRRGYLFTYDYDEAGRLVSERKEGMGYTGTVAYVYDSAGRIQEKQVDAGANGSVDERTRYTYGPGWVRGEDLRDGESVSSRTYHIDDRGRLVSIDWSSGTATEITWEGCEPVLARQVLADGTPRSTQRWSWSEEAHLMTDTRDDDGDGVPDSELGFVYDEAGRVVEKWRDVTGDGQADTRWTFRYCE